MVIALTKVIAIAMNSGKTDPVAADGEQLVLVHDGYLVRTPLAQDGLRGNRVVSLRIPPRPSEPVRHTLVVSDQVRASLRSPNRESHSG